MGISTIIERTWSLERYQAGLAAYNGSIVIHDVARKNSVVHTDYPDLANASIDNLFLTHNPDNLTAWKPILTSGKRLVLRDGEVFESANGKFYPFDADVYVHHFSCDMVGYRSENGAYKVIEKDDLLGVVEAGSPEKGLMRVDLYQDIKGGYFPILTDSGKYYAVRPDGKVEVVTISKATTRGKVAKNMRGRIKKGVPGKKHPRDRKA